MKKIWLIMVMMAISGIAFAGDTPTFKGLNSGYGTNMLNSGSSSGVGQMQIVLHLNAVSYGGVSMDALSLSNIRLVKRTSKGESFPQATFIRIKSGIKGDTTGDDELITTKIKTGERVYIPLDDFGKMASQPFVEHFYGIGNAGNVKNLPLLLHANSIWVCSKEKNGKPDLETLFIGVVSYPDGTKLPLKLAIEYSGATVDDGTYLTQRSHPELIMSPEKLRAAKNALKQNNALASN